MLIVTFSKNATSTELKSNQSMTKIKSMNDKSIWQDSNLSHEGTDALDPSAI